MRSITQAARWTGREAQIAALDPLKNRWPCPKTLDTVGRIEKLVAFYVDEHNTDLDGVGLLKGGCP